MYVTEYESLEYLEAYIRIRINESKYLNQDVFNVQGVETLVNSIEYALQ